MMVTGTSTKAFFKGVETWNKETIMKKVSKLFSSHNEGNDIK